MARMETTNFRKIAAFIKGNRLYILLALGALALVCWPVFIGQFYAVGDMRDVYIPLELFFQHQLRAGEFPAWNPTVAWGFPVLAAAQIGVYYPPLLLARLLFPIFIYLPLVFAGHALAAAIGMWLFMRAVFGVNKSSAAFSAAAFAGSAFLWQHTTHLNIFFAVAWLPWQLLLMHRLGKNETLTLRDYALAIIVLGTPFLIGQLQIPLLMAAISSFYYLYTYTKGSAKSMVLKRYRRAIGLIIAFAIGVVLLASAQLIPTLELFQFSSRSSTEGFSVERANQYSFPVYHLPTAVFPRFYGNDDTYWGKRLEIEYGIYIGIAPLILGLWGLWRYRKVHPYFAYLAVLSFLLALGSLSPVRLAGIEPSLWVFSAPARWLLFTTLGMSVFAGLAFNNLSRLETSVRRWVVCVAVVSLVLAGVMNIFLHSPMFDAEALYATASRFTTLHNEPQYYIDKIGVLVQSARATSVSLTSPATWVSVGLLAALPFLLRRPKLLLVLTIFEVSLIAAITTPAVPWKEIRDTPDTVAFLPESVREGDARIYSIRDGGDTGAVFTDPASRADADTRRAQRQLLVPMIHSQFGISGIEWPASLDFQSHTDMLNTLRASQGYAIADLDYAESLNIGAVLVPAELDTFATEPGYIVNGIAIHELDAAPRAYTDAGDAVTYTQLSPSHVRLSNIPNEDSAELTVLDTWYPGWKAISDTGERLSMRPQGAFRRIRVPAGVDVIDMTYVPISVYAALGISSITALGLLYVLTRKKT